MVFAINAVESGPNNFAAFQELAMRINGTGVPGSSPSSGANPTGSSTGSNTNGDDANAAITAWRPTAGAVVALVGAVVAWAL
ncbi:hypothetical protein AX16_005349 [Volvariella volvacea WC 439]|nr:hypothetical protein AX16_005349 [Volvariella volvacea WC 439]